MPTKRFASLVAFVVLGTPIVWDLGRHLTNTGIYRCDVEGTLVSARPTIKSVYGFFSDDAMSRRSGYERNRRKGRYVAKLRTPEGRRVKISVSRNDYRRLETGQYVVCRQRTVRVFPDKAAYDAARPKTP